MDDNCWTPGLRGMVDMPVEHGVWPVLAWSLTPGERVSKAIQDAAAAFALATGVDAMFAFVWEMPKGAPGGEIAPEIGEVMLIAVDWAPVGFVVLARGGMTKIRSEFKSWRKTGGAV